MAAEQKNGIEDSVAPSCLEGPFFSQTIEDLVAPSRFKEPFFYGNEYLRLQNSNAL